MGPEAAGFSVTGREKEFLPVAGGGWGRLSCCRPYSQREAEQLVSVTTAGKSLGLENIGTQSNVFKMSV